MPMTILGWLVALLAIVLLVAVTVALVRLLGPNLGIGNGRALQVIVILFAVFGAIAVAGGAGMLLMHLGMRLTGCC